VRNFDFLVPANLDELKMKTRRDAPPSSLYPLGPISSLSFVLMVSLIYRDVQNVEFLNNPARFLDPYLFRVTSECTAPEDGAFLTLLYTRVYTRISIGTEEITDSSHKESISNDA